MAEVCIVVEGRSDVAILRPFLARTIGRPFRFFASGGRNGLATIGRNILVHEGNPVLVAMDADTFDAASAAEACGMVRAALRRFSSDDLSDAFAFIPEIEVIFFEAAPLLIRRGIDPAQIERGLYRPKLVLSEELTLLGQTLESFVKGLTDEDIDDLRGGDQASRFLQVVEHLVSSADRETLVHPAAGDRG